MKYLHFNNTNTGYNLKHAPQKIKKALQSRTVAVEPVSIELFSQIANDFLVFKAGVVVGLELGISFLHPSDRYVKSTGRAQAKANLKMTMIEVEGMVVTKTHVFIKLAPVAGIRLNLRLNKISGFSTVTGSLVSVGEYLGDVD